MRKLRQGSVAFLGGLLIAGAAWAAPPERPTLNHTMDPRPNILPNWIYNHHVPYRLRYNRPTYHGGKIAYHISPTSQEAMAWEENLDRGRYDGFHCPPMYKRYFYPKPWEALNTGPRATYATKPGAFEQVPVQPEGVVPRLEQGAADGEPIQGARSSRPGATAPEPEPGEPDVIPRAQRRP